MFWAIWAAVGRLKRKEKSQPPGHCGGKGRQVTTTRRARGSWGQAQAAGTQQLGELGSEVLGCTVQSCSGNG